MSYCRWLEVLRCISRWELLQQIASGMPTDAVLFAGQGKAGDKGKAGASIKDQLKKLNPAAAGPDTPLAGRGCRACTCCLPLPRACLYTLGGRCCGAAGVSEWRLSAALRQLVV